MVSIAVGKPQGSISTCTNSSEKLETTALLLKYWFNWAHTTNGFAQNIPILSRRLSSSERPEWKTPSSAPSSSFPVPQIAWPRVRSRGETRNFCTSWDKKLLFYVKWDTTVEIKRKRFPDFFDRRDERWAPQNLKIMTPLTTAEENPSVILEIRDSQNLAKLGLESPLYSYCNIKWGD